MMAGVKAGELAKHSAPLFCETVLYSWYYFVTEVFDGFTAEAIWA